MSNQQLIVITILGWGIGSIFYKVANNNIHPVMVSTIVTGMFILLTPVSFKIFDVDCHINTTGVIFSLLGGFTMCVGTFAYFYALKNGGAGEVTTMVALYPALTLILSVLFMNEGMTLRKGIGVSLALLSVLLLSKK